MTIRNMKGLGLQGVTGCFIGADSKYLDKCNRESGFQLPEDYKDFLTQYGVSLFSEEVGFRPLVASRWAVNGVESFDLFYGVSDKPQFDLVRNNIRLSDLIPDRTIVIGHDPGSNLILLGADGSVRFLDRESGQCSLCARDFSSFLDSFELQNQKPIVSS